MNRTLIAAALAAAMLPALAAGASAASFGRINRTYTLSCAVNQTDGVSLKSGMLIVTNTSPHVIRQGTRIDIVIVVRTFPRPSSVVYSQVAFRNVNARDTIAFSQPRGRVLSCTAKVTLQPYLETQIKKIVR